MSIHESAFKVWWERYGSGFASEVNLVNEQLAHYAFEAGYLAGRQDPKQLALDLLMVKADALESEG